MRWPKTTLPVDEICERYRAGETTHELAAAYGTNPQAIGYQLLKRGVKMRPRGHRKWRKPGGALYFSNSGYLYTVTRAIQPCPVHRGCWEAHHGPIPNGWIVHHINGDIQDNRIENLACMSRRDHGLLHNPMQPNSRRSRRCASSS